MNQTSNFDISQYTNATLRMDARIQYRGKTAAQVFDIMGDPERITDWYLLAKTVKMHPKVEGEEQTFNWALSRHRHALDVRRTRPDRTLRTIAPPCYVALDVAS